jgi:hypothetical protein
MVNEVVSGIPRSKGDILTEDDLKDVGIINYMMANPNVVKNMTEREYKKFSKPEEVKDERD